MPPAGLADSKYIMLPRWWNRSIAVPRSRNC
jgi:hypothetical protein